MKRFGLGSGRGPGIAVGLVAALVVGMAAAVPAGAQTAAPNDCPAVMPVDELRKGMTGYGVTVADGRTPTTFEVEVLGVLKDGLAPGRDLIIVDTAGPEIERAGGIWYGMSGSPVYVGDKLIGAVAFGLSFGPNTVGGLTPAAEMMRVLEYPDDAGPEPSETSARRAPMGSGMRRTIAQETGSSTEEVGPAFVRLPVPVSVSGLPDRARHKLSRVIDRENLPIIPFAGNAAAGDTTVDPAADVNPGDNFAGAISYGDITFAGVGTVTFICNGRAMAFGHPFFWEGDTTLGGNAADTITIVKDPIFGSYELASIAEPVAEVDQDRLAGIRGRMGTFPSLIPITSSIASLDTGRSRDGRTDAVIDEAVPFLSFFHVYSNILVTVDEYSEGSSSASWTITGTTESGETWEFTRQNKYASEYDIAGQTSYELDGILYNLFYNDFEDIGFSSIDFDASIEEEVRRYTLTDVLVSTTGKRFEDRRRVRANPGDTVFLRVVLTPSDGTEDRQVDLTVQVPTWAGDSGLVEIAGGQGGDSEVCLYDPEECVDSTGNKIESFEDLLAFLEASPTNDELVARLRIGRKFRVKSTDSELLDRVVSGRMRVRVLVGDGGGRGEEVIGKPR